ncbi:MAG: hypothetical protein Q8R13_02995 [bacterium]|nr:hypothetical protein [bacterium]
MEKKRKSWDNSDIFNAKLPLAMDDPHRADHVAKTLIRQGIDSFSDAERQQLRETAEQLFGKRAGARPRRPRRNWVHVTRVRR